MTAMPFKIFKASKEDMFAAIVVLGGVAVIWGGIASLLIVSLLAL